MACPRSSLIIPRVLVASLALLGLLSCDDDDGLETTFTQTTRIPSTDYIKNRYYRLSTSQLGAIYFPEVAGQRPALQETPGYDPNQLEIDPNSIELFVTVTTATGTDILDVHEGLAFVDDTGRGWETVGIPFDPGVLSSYSASQFVRRRRWRALAADAWSLLLDHDEVPIGIQLHRSLGEMEALATVYTVVDKTSRAAVYRVGRSPRSSPGTVQYTAPGSTQPEEIYLFKLIKPDMEVAPRVEAGEWGSKDLTWEYMFRNRYALPSGQLDPQALDVAIHRLGAVDNPQVDARYGIPWLRVFGLDQVNEMGGDPNTPDGHVDTTSVLFDFYSGALEFPDFTPFGLPDARLAQYADIAGYTLDPSLKVHTLYTGVYNASDPVESDQHFDIVIRYRLVRPD